jgi:hypothetical protein
LKHTKGEHLLPFSHIIKELAENSEKTIYHVIFVLIHKHHISMRTILLAIATLALVSSCRKQYICNCTYPTGKRPASQNVLIESRKADATLVCSQLNIDAKVDQGSCALKD